MTLLLSLLIACGEKDPENNDDTGSTGTDDSAEPVDTGPFDEDGDGVVASEDCDDDNADAWEVATWYAVAVCDDADAEVNPGMAEDCNGADDDCNGEVDDGSALGTGATCAAEDCVAVLEAGNTDSDLYWIDFGEHGIATAFCEQEREGGGWMLMWKQHGGASGAEESTNTLWSSEGARNDVVPHDQLLTSEVTSLAYPLLSATEDVELLEVQTLYDPTGEVEAEHEIRMAFLGTSFAGFFTTMDPAINAWSCHTAPGDVQVFIDGVDAGTTNVLVSYFQASSSPVFGVGLANTHASYSCGQSTGNLIDVNAVEMHRVDNGLDHLSVRGIFSYNHLAEDGDATDCTFGCWDADYYGGYYDGQTWYGRPPQD